MHIVKKKKKQSKKKTRDTGLFDTFPTDNTWSLFVGSDKGFKQRSWSYTGERKEKIFEKVERWRKIAVKIQTFVWCVCPYMRQNICLMCLPIHETIGEWKARRAVRQGTEGRTFSPLCHLVNLSAILHFMSPLSPNIIWLIPRYTNMALLESFYISTTTN